MRHNLLCSSIKTKSAEISFDNLLILKTVSVLGCREPPHLGILPSSPGAFILVTSVPYLMALSGLYVLGLWNTG